MFHYRQLNKVQIANSFIGVQWHYIRSLEKRKICGTVPYSGSNLRVYFAHNRKCTSVRWASSANAENVQEYDYVIVGAGSAGCVLANRLTGSDQTTKVLVVEAGPAADINWKVRMPAAFIQCLNDPRYDWCYESIPQVKFQY